MTSTAKTTKRTEVSGFHTLTVGQQTNALRVLEAELLKRGVDPAKELKRLNGRKSQTLLEQLGNIFTHQNKEANLHADHAYKLFQSRGDKQGKGKILTMKGWEGFRPEDRILRDPRTRRIVSNYFPWRPIDLNGPAINAEGEEWQESFAFLSLTTADTRNLLRSLRINSNHWNNVKFVVNDYITKGMDFADEYEWVLMPRNQFIELTGNETQEERLALVPEGYEIATYREVLNYIIGSQIVGCSLTSNAYHQGGFVCEGDIQNYPMVLHLSYDNMTDSLSEVHPMYLRSELLAEAKVKKNLILPIKKKLPDYYLRLKEKAKNKVT